MQWFLMGAAGLHVLFMLAELFPWSFPALLRAASQKLPSNEPFTAAQQKLVATVVHNAGIYNGIVAGGLLWSAFGGAPVLDVARVMLMGAVVAGVFGAVTIQSPVPAVQALVGIIGLFLTKL